MSNRIAAALACAALLFAAPAFAQTSPPAEKQEKAEKPKGHAPAQTHHCYKDGKLMADLTHKKCTAAGGQWKKDVPAKDEAAKPAPSAEPKAEPAPAPAK